MENEQKFEETIKMGLDIVKETEEDRLMTLSVGPQHPGSGHFRFTIKVDGDYIVFCDPDPGYVHRGEEKMCEYRNFIQNIPHLERPVIHDGWIDYPPNRNKKYVKAWRACRKDALYCSNCNDWRPHNYGHTPN